MSLALILLDFASVANKQRFLKALLMTHNNSLLLKPVKYLYADQGGK